MQSFITDIKVNIAYDIIDDANLSQYEYFSKWLLDLKKDNERKFLQWLHLDYVLGNQFFTFNKNTLEYFHNSNEKFIYPILLYSNDLFDKYNLTVLDRSPFQEFILNCIGKPIALDRLERLSIIEKKEKGSMLKFRYDPKDKSGKVPKYSFPNTSGNQVINDKFLIIKNLYKLYTNTKKAIDERDRLYMDNKANS